MEKVLEFRWSVSRGRDTYGYNICSLWIHGKKVSSCNGGGYDMKGTALGNWIEDTLQKELHTLSNRAIRTYHIKKGKYELRPNTWEPKKGRLYGLTKYINFDKKETTYSLDGACGFSSMETILNAMGYKIKYIFGDNNRSTYLLTSVNE